MFSDELVHHLVDMLSPLGAVRAKRMFGGHGIYLGDDMFALVSEDVLYFKVDEGNIDDYRRRALEAFIYRRRGRPIALSFRQAPEEALDDEELLCAWAQRALEAARRAGKAARKRNANETEAAPRAKKSAATAAKPRSSGKTAGAAPTGGTRRGGKGAAKDAEKREAPAEKKPGGRSKQAATAKAAPANKKTEAGSGTAKKTASRSGAAKKTAARSGAAKKAATRPGATKKTASRSGATKKAATRPGATKKTASRSGAAKAPASGKKAPGTRRKAS